MRYENQNILGFCYTLVHNLLTWIASLGRLKKYTCVLILSFLEFFAQDIVTIRWPASIALPLPGKFI